MSIEIRNLSKQFSSHLPFALQGIDVSFPPQKIVGLVGSDGSGKTTLLRLIAALLLPTEGTITVAGCDTMKKPEEIHKFTSYMPQRFGLYEDLSVLQNLELYADLRSVALEERKKTFEKLLQFTGLSPFQQRLAGNLSGGMKQKLGLACALVKKPKLLLLDEPSVGVDPLARRDLWSIVKGLLEEGISVVWSTSYLDEAERCDSVLLLSQGKMLYSGSPQEFTKKLEGRVVRVKGKRGLLKKMLEKKEVLDGVIEADSLRLVLRNDVKLLDTIPVKPRFEDAFVDLLGTSSQSKSSLADEMPEVATKSCIAISAKNLTKKFGSFVAVDDISFSVRQGEIFGLLGPNGSGKSTTFKMLTGLLKPTSGQAFINELDLQKAPSLARSNIGYMAQKFSLYEQLSTYQNLQFFSGIYNLSGSTQKKSVQHMIDLFSLTPYLHIKAQDLPLGLKQRLAIACATMHRPSVLFLDEPTSGVDPLTRREFWRHINALVEKKVTILISTHFMDEAEYCDQIGLIYQGRLIHAGTPETLKQLAKTKEIQEPTLEEAFITLIGGVAP